MVFNFEKYFDSNSIIDAIDKIPYPSKSTYTGIGLDLVRTGLFEISERQGVRDVLIVMTDGASQVRIFDNKIVSKVIMFLNVQPPPKILCESIVRCFPIASLSLKLLKLS